MDLQLPTVISSSTILNAVIRGAERAARELGPDYRALVTGDFSAAVRVYRITERSSSDVLSPNRPVPKSEAPIWSMKLSKGELEGRDAPKFLKDHPLRFFFLTRAEAEEYIEALEQRIIAHIIDRSATAGKEAS